MDKLPSVLSKVTDVEFPLFEKTKNEHLVFSERVWGLKKFEEFLFDPAKYGVSDYLDQIYPYPVMSDTLVNYYSSGRREVVPAKQVYIFHVDENSDVSLFFDRSYKKRGSFATMEQMLTLFPNDSYLQMLVKKYPYLHQNARFYLPDRSDNYELAMKIKNSRSYEGSLRGIFEQHTFSTLANLQRRFALTSKVLSGHLTKEELDAWKKWKEVDIVVLKNNYYYRSSMKLLTGYVDIPYRVAEAILRKKGQDTFKLREKYLEYGEPLTITGKYDVYSTNECNDYSTFNEHLGCPESGVFVFEPEVYHHWGREFTPRELAVINRERYFEYFNPDMKKNQKTKNTLWTKIRSLWDF